MSKLNKFPYKHMVNIVNALADGEEKSVLELRKSTNACYPDTSEVSQMVSYLTSFGRIAKTEGGWTRTAENDSKPNKPGRIHYLREVMEIIKVLDSSLPKSEAAIAEETGFELGLIKEFLPFLAAVTEHGYIVNGGSLKKSYRLVPLEDGGN